MRKGEKSKRSVRRKSTKKISSAALAEYLDGLAKINDSEETGNPFLAEALRGLARAVRHRTVRLAGDEGRVPSASDGSDDLSRKGYRPRKDPNVSKGNLDSSKVSNWTEREIRDFIDDLSNKKEDLLQLAALRFSMPLSQLRRSRIEEIRSAIISALLHESSIEIISKEAEREGRARSS